MLKNHSQFKSRNKQSLLNIGGFISALIFVAIVGFVLYRSLSTALLESERASAIDIPQVQDEQLKKALKVAEKWKEEVISPQVIVEPSPTAVTPALAELRIAVRNGTTIPGLASQAADKLREAGFTQIVAISNAKKQSYGMTVIQVKKSLNSYIGGIRQALSLSTDATNVEELQEDWKFDIVVIVGRERR